MKTLVLFFFVCPLYFGQPQPVTNTFKISGDNPSGSFIQKNPELFYYDSTCFVIIWDDYKNGPLQYYATKFSPLGISQSSNFEIKGNIDFHFYDANTFFTVRNESYSDWLNYYGQIRTANAVLNNNISIGSVYIPWCATGWMGTSHTFTRVNNNILVFFNDGNEVKHSKFDGSGNLLATQSDSLFMVAGQKVTTLQNQYHALFFAIPTAWEPTIIQPGIYGRFFNNNEQVIADSVRIFKLPIYGTPGYDVDVNLRTVPLEGNKYFVSYANRDSLFFRILSSNGIFLSEAVSLPIKRWEYPNYSITNFSISSPSNGKFDLLITIKSNASSTLSKYLSSVFTFTTDGNYIGETGRDSIFSTTLGSNLFKIGEQKYFIPYHLNDDIYLAELTNFVITPIRKINEEPAGSHEVSSINIIRDENSVLNVWQDGSGSKGRLISQNGNNLSSIINMPSKDVRFFSDNTAVTFDISNEKIVVRNLSSELNILSTDTLMVQNQIIDEVTSYYVKMLPGDRLLFLVSTVSKAFLLITNRNLQMEKKVDLTFGSTSHNATIFSVGEEFFYASLSGRLQKFDLQLNSLSSDKNFWAHEYIGDDIFLKVDFYPPNQTTGYYGWYGDLIKFDSTVIRQKIFFTNSAVEFFYSTIYKGVFGISYFDFHGKMNFKSYNSLGNSTATLMNIFNNNGISTINGGFRAWNDNIIFTWSDNTDGNYDVWGKIFSVRSLVDAKDNKTLALNKFELMQNYPNPFNPSTKIKFTIPSLSLRERVSEGRVRATLKVFDILGREVAILVDEEKSAGVYEVEFDASLLPSGIYFYRLQSGELVQEKKMILLK